MFFGNRKYKAITLAVLMIVLTGLCSCGNDEFNDSLSDYEASDMSGYEGLEDYDKDLMFVDMTVDEMDKLMDKRGTFVVFFSFEDCPYCNRLISYLNDATLDAGVKIGYINTRANPEWKSNMDIDGYDTVIKRFGDYIGKDSSGKAHLYVPSVFFVKKGKITAYHDGVTPGADDPSQELTADQEDRLRKDLADEFNSLK